MLNEADGELNRSNGKRLGLLNYLAGLAEAWVWGAWRLEASPRSPVEVYVQTGIWTPQYHSTVLLEKSGIAAAVQRANFASTKGIPSIILSAFVIINFPPFNFPNLPS